MRDGTTTIELQRVRDGVRSAAEDVVAVEEPLEIRLGYDTPEGRAQRSISITMRTPGDDLALAAGFLFTEGIVTSAADIATIAAIISDRDSNIENVSMENRDGLHSSLTFVVAIRDRNHLADIIRGIRSVPQVARIMRTHS